MKKPLKFNELGLSPETLAVLEKRGFEEPTPIQSQAIPILLQDDIDIIGQAQTGTGKTAAFALPIIEKLNEDTKEVQALILAPTRELAVQVSDEISSYKGNRKYSVIPIYGGQHITEQIRHLKKGAQIVVGTPGRILDHLRRRTLKLGGIRFLVLDEADEMLNMGFIDDVEEIMAQCNEKKQVALFSATMPARIEALTTKYMKEVQRVVVQKQQITADLTDQLYFEVRSQDRFEALCRIIDMEEEFYGLIFCRTKVDVDQIAAKLIERGYDADCIHGDITQKQRENVLKKFKEKRSTILVATDVAARGLDINNLSHVINFALPQEPEAYVHRIGRTGRAGKKGVAITFITPSEYRKLAVIQRLAKADIRKEQVPEIADIIQIKRDRLSSEIVETMREGKLEAFGEMGFGLMNKFSVEELVPALLKLIIQDRLDESQYKEIGKPSSSPGKGKTRLLVALGRKSGYTPRKLIDFLTTETGLHDRFIDDLLLRDDFSFITVPTADAERIVKQFDEKAKGKRPLIVIAKGDKKEGGRGRESKGSDRSSRPAYGGRDKRPDRERKSGDRPSRPGYAGKDKFEKRDYKSSDRPSRPAYGGRDKGPDGERKSSDRPSRPAYAGKDKFEKRDHKSSDRPSRPAYGDRDKGPDGERKSADRPSRPGYAGKDKFEKRDHKSSDRPSRPGYAGKDKFEKRDHKSSDRPSRPAREDRDTRKDKEPSKSEQGDKKPKKDYRQMSKPSDKKKGKGKKKDKNKGKRKKA
jgi:ATP-dependent RNA helicase DeaD